MKLRSLFLAAAGVLLLTAVLVPRTNATELIYFNLEDRFTSPPGFDNTSDQTIATGGDNNGGGIQSSLLTLNYPSGDFSTVPGLLANRTFIGNPAGSTANDSDTANPGQALGFTRSSDNNGAYIQFPVNATFFQNMSLSLAVNNNGNGFTTMRLDYSTNGGATFTLGTTGAGTLITGITSGTSIVTFPVPTAVNGQSNVILRVTFLDGHSNGNDLQTVIDNIQLYGTVIPEPATVVGGLLGVFGLCWHQRQRLIRFVRLRRA